MKSINCVFFSKMKLGIIYLSQAFVSTYRGIYVRNYCVNMCVKYTVIPPLNEKKIECFLWSLWSSYFEKWSLNLFFWYILHQVPVGSQKYRKMLNFVHFHIFVYSQIWLKTLMDDCHQGRHHKIDEETKKLAIPTTMNAMFFFSQYIF
jgi:hypothetical protein